MKFFIAGIHAVGKTYLCRDYALNNSCVHKSASELIREYKDKTWKDSKLTSEIDSNQEVLIQALEAFTNENANDLLLDGHFVLLDEHGKFKSIAPSIFIRMNINGVILIEDDKEVISKRLIERGVNQVEYDINEFACLERQHAEKISNMLGVKLIKLQSPSCEDFSKAIKSI
ncbi:AAA family ATPase [Aeromonas veronii]|uniref:AAA family ATPase n=1 Tax=Aeromonas veronii TaxID=654 RepID=UPI003D199443